MRLDHAVKRTLVPLTCAALLVGGAFPWIEAKLWPSSLADFVAPIQGLPDGGQFGPKSVEEAIGLLQDVHADHRATLFCDCAFTHQGALTSGCAFSDPRSIQTVDRVAWTPLLPVRRLTGERACWTQSGDQSPLDHCLATDEVVRRVHADPYLLVPVVAPLLDVVHSYRMVGRMSGEDQMHCPTKIDPDAREIEPRAEVRGDLARMVLYTVNRYNLRLQDQEMKLVQAWSNDDPIDAWERERAQRIAARAGWTNDIVLTNSR